MSKRKNNDKASSVSRAERLLQIKDADAKVMEITLKGIEFLDYFARDMYNRLNGELKDLPSIISQMGICGEQITVVFHGIAFGEDLFTVSVMDDPKNPKVYECAMRTGSMINPYPGFYLEDGKTRKEFSWQEKDKKVEIIYERALVYGSHKKDDSYYSSFVDDYGPDDIAP